jgi:hypothetical protein
VLLVVVSFLERREPAWADEVAEAAGFVGGQVMNPETSAGRFAGHAAAAWGAEPEAEVLAVARTAEVVAVPGCDHPVADADHAPSAVWQVSRSLVLQ